MAWWINVIVLVVASGIDLRTRRIPNGLTLPFLVSGVAIQSVGNGWRGLGQSLAGIGLAVLLFGLPCFFKGMGMGDLKLAAGVAAWIGPGQAVTAFVVTGIVGGAMAVCYALRHGSLGRSLDNTGELIIGRGGPGASERMRSGLGPLSIPYAPAIAIGTLFSFFTQ